MKIIIFGASGTGTTTLASEVAKQTGFVHLDVDDYYWKKTNPPFQQKVPLAERNATLTADFEKYDDVIVSGSLVSWGREWESAFDLAVFITLDNDVRMERLRKREEERYGDLLQTNETYQQTSAAFLEWASQYDHPWFEGRSLKIHEEWIDRLSCKVLRLDGQMSLAEKAKRCHRLSGATTINKKP